MADEFVSAVLKRWEMPELCATFEGERKEKQSSAWCVHRTLRSLHISGIE